MRQTWSIRLQRSGFEDLETSGAGGMLSNRGAPTRTGLLDRTQKWTRQQSVDQRVSFERQHTYIANVAGHYQRMERLASRFEDELDQQIGVALSDGVDVRTMKARLRVGQSRIARIAKQLRLWMAEPEETTDGEE